jgi:Ca2+-binding RTX toxin-like protein
LNLKVKILPEFVKKTLILLAQFTSKRFMEVHMPATSSLEITNILSVESSSFSTYTITENLFGGNILHSTNTNDGRPDEEFIYAQSELDIGSLRYPAGQADQVYRDGILDNGQLPQHVVNFMNWAVESDTKVVIVTPTHPPSFDPLEIQAFVSLLVELYPNQIEAFEIGNEFWMSMGETEYGRMADASIAAINSGIGDTEGPDIWVQMANASAAFTDFKSDYGSWSDRVNDSNEAIIAELSDASRNAIDGVVDHYYYRSQTITSTNENHATNYIGVEHDIWESRFDRDLTLNITEWNIKSSNETQLGITAASTLIAQFQYLIELEVDTAYVWPPQHNMPNDLAGSMNAVIDPESGIVINTVIGAVFDMMSTSLIGLSSLDLTIETNVEDIVTYAFGDVETRVIYIASRSDEVTELNFDLNFWGGMQLTSALQVGYDQETSNGVYYSPREGGWVEAEYVYVDGEQYFLNEHDVMAEITSLETSTSNDEINLVLDPYEVVQLTFTIPTPIVVPIVAPDPTPDPIPVPDPDPTPIPDPTPEPEPLPDPEPSRYFIGGSGNDHFLGGSGNDRLIGQSGADTLIGGAGDDFLGGGNGNDWITGGMGHDTIYGASGNDTIDGNEGNDLIFALANNDLIDGGTGNDTIWGGGGNDTVIGGSGGRDFNFMGSGNDVFTYVPQGAPDLGSSVWLGIGNDRAVTGDGNDLVYGMRGIDVIMTHGGDDTVYSGSENDTVDGGAGDDVLWVGEGDDSLIAGDGDDLVYARDGDDYVLAGNGDDTVWGGPGNDTVNVGQGSNTGYLGSGNDLYIHDTTAGDTGDDFVFLGDGNDTVLGGHGDDVFQGMGGDDMIQAGRGDDTIWGGVGADRLYGGDGNDVVRGGLGPDLARLGAGDDLFADTAQGGTLGRDTVHGGSGNDTIRGASGDDVFYGDSGNDMISGGEGQDTLSGGSGADDFVFERNGGLDRITDFNLGEDALYLDVPQNNVAGLSIRETGGTLQIGWTGGGVILEGVFRSDFDTDDIFFI